LACSSGFGLVTGLTGALFCVTFLTRAAAWALVLAGCPELPLKPVVDDEPQLNEGFCDEGQYADIKFILLQPKDATIIALIADGFCFLTASLVGCFMILFIPTLATIGCAIPVGLFISNILSGVCLGQAFGLLLLDSGMKACLDMYALMDAAGLLASFRRKTILLAVIFLQIANNMYLLLPSLLVIMTSNLLGCRFGLCVYDMVLELNLGIRLLDVLCEDQQLVLEGLKAHHVCTAEVVVLMPIHPQEKIARVMVATTFGYYPVAARNNRFLGTVSRTDLVVPCIRAEAM